MAWNTTSISSTRAVIVDFDQDCVRAARPYKRAIVEDAGTCDAHVVVCTDVFPFRLNHELQTRRIARFLAWADARRVKGISQMLRLSGLRTREFVQRQELVFHPRPRPPPSPTPRTHGLDFGVKPMPKSQHVSEEAELEPELPAIEQAYLRHGLHYIRFDAPIERRENGKCKIGGFRPPFSFMTRQLKYRADSGRYYSLLMGREYRPGKLLMLLDIDNKEEEGTVNGLEFQRLLDLDRFGAPKQRTPSGGFHYLFYVDSQDAHRVGQRTTMMYQGRRFNVDVKFKNALMNCAPSTIDGYGAYEWVNPEQLGDIPRLPDELLEIIAASETRNLKQGARRTTVEPPLPVVPADDDLLHDCELLCRCLSKARLDNYETWIKLGFCLKGLGCPLSLWDEVSRRSPKYRSGDCASKWPGLRASGCTINVLLAWAKDGNLELYDQLRPTLRMSRDCLASEDPPDTLEIDVDTLLPREGVARTSDHQAFAEVIQRFTSDHAVKTLAVKSRYASGKTHFLRELIGKQGYERVLFITYRQSLARDIRRNFRSLGFENYLDGYDRPGVWSSPRLIVQLDSLMNVMLKSDEYLMTGEWNAHYDMIVLDECESLLAHLDEGTMTGKAIETFDFLDELLRISSKIVCLDGDLSGRTMDFARSYGDLAYVKNRNQAPGKSIRVARDPEAWKTTFHADLDRFHQEDPEFRVAVACQAACQVEDLRDALATSHPHLTVITLTGQDCGETKRLFFENINETFSKANVLIYSPVIESGVDITIPVRKVYGKLSSKSNSQRAYLQMLARCRNVADGEVVLLADPAFAVNRNFSFWRFKEVEALNRESLGLTEARLRVDGDTMTMTANTGSKRKIVSIYNETEKLNKNPGIFLNYLKTLAEGKGYGWSVDELPDGQERPKRETVASAKANRIAEAEDLTKEELMLLMDARKAGKTTVSENYALDKCYWKRELGVDELDPKLLKPYLYDDLLGHFLGLVDVANHRAEDTMASVQFRERRELALELIRGLGFSGILDEQVVNQATFMANFARDVVGGRAFANLKRINELFGFGRRRRIHGAMEVKEVITWANRILRRYSLAVSRRGDRVRLVRENGILEVVQRRNERGSYFEDAAGILNQPTRRWVPVPGLGRHLDAFLD